MLAKLCKCILGIGPSSSGEEDRGKDAEDPSRRRKSILQLVLDGGDNGEKRRHVRANDREFNAQFNYADNFIRTSKYTLLTFVPYNLCQQFTRIANFYFLVLLFLQLIPQITSVPWIYTFIPLSIVLLFSAIKEAFDDLQRHRSDKQVNKRISYLVRNNRLVEEEWMHVKVGDIIRMENQHFIAADLLLLSTSEPHGICYIETAELDGETNLKTRAALPETVPLDDVLKAISEFDGEIICESPNNRLDHFEGRLEWRGNVMPLDNKNMLLRGCRLRNTRWCYGLVVFAGKDTKLMRNSGEAPMKRTSLDRFLNLLIFGIVLFLLAMCLICTLMTGFWEHIVGRHFRIFLPWDDIVPQIKSLTTIRLKSVEDEERSIAPSQVFFISALQFFSYIILLNTVVPISLYISVEMVRLVHSLFINWDKKMYYEKTDTPARARTTTLNEELGQVQYVFSDKTGTLTQNIMIFKKCSINGRSYGDVMSDRGEIVDIDEERMPGLDFAWNRWHEPNFRFYDQTLMEDTKRGVREVHEFWRLLAICHTVMPERRPGNVLDYQAQSPDEAALTSAARNFGFVFKSRTPQSITVEVNGREEVYEVLHILDFDNVRKRMSVLLRSRSGKIKLYCKGADTIILERISARRTSDLLRTATIQHLDKFARDGLRTLCVAYRPVDAAYCEQWMLRLKGALLDAERKVELVDALYEEMEREMLLLGATAIEDKLQDGVPQTISTLTAANIKIWVLTGDKTETAINIGYACQLLTEDMREVFIIDGKEEREVEVQLKDIKRRIQSAKVPTKTLDGSSFYLPPRTPIRELSPATDLPSGIAKTPSSQTGPTTFPVHILSLDEKYDAESLPALDEANHIQWTLNSSTLSAPTQNGIGPLENNAGNKMPDGEGEPEGISGDGGYALVINGESLGHALKRRYEKTFLEIGCNCVSVICCRVTPLQKAQVVDLVKRNIKAVTLAIGDGANDVSMIRAAHIGVGISGQEGMQAVLSSDFSIAQFRYLERLLLVHGRWSYMRMCKFLRYFFYKNFAYTLAHFWYSFFCGFSAQTVFDPVLTALYNLFFTSMPVLAMGILDQDVSEQYSLRFPRLYIPGQFNLFFNMRIFIYSIIHGMISSLVLFFVPFGTLYRAINQQGRDDNDYAMLAFTTFTGLVLVVTGQIAFDTSYWTFWNWLMIVGSLLFYFFVVLVVYEFAPIGLLYGYVSSLHLGVVYRALAYPPFWLSLLLICAILLLPVIGNRFFWFDTHPSYADRLQVRHKLYKDDELREDEEAKRAGKWRGTTTRRTGRRRGSLRSGYAFSHTPGFGELIAKGTLFKNLEHLRIPSFHHGGAHKPDRRHSSLLKTFVGAAVPAPSLPPSAVLSTPPSDPSLSSSTPPSSSLLTPAKLTSINELEVTDDEERRVPVEATSSVTTFSPGSANATTTTTLLASKWNGQSPPPPAASTQTQLPPPNVGHLMGREGNIDSTPIEHLPGSVDKIDFPAIASEAPTAVGGSRREAPWPNCQTAQIATPREPIPNLESRVHNLVVNADLDEQMPMPRNWRRNQDGTLRILPELDETCQPGNRECSSKSSTSNSESGNGLREDEGRRAGTAAKATPEGNQMLAKTRACFSKKRHEFEGQHGMTIQKMDASAHVGQQRQTPPHNGRTSVQWEVAPSSADLPPHSMPADEQTRREQQKRIFTGKRRGVQKVQSNEGGEQETEHGKTTRRGRQPQRTPLPITRVPKATTFGIDQPARLRTGTGESSAKGNQDGWMNE